MDAGQMMMPAPVNPAMPAAIPLSPGDTVLAGDQQSGGFAGVLAGLTPQQPSRTGEATGMAKTIARGATAAGAVPAVIPLQPDVAQEVLAAPVIRVTLQPQTEPEAADVGQGQAEPARDKLSEDVVMPQNVVLCMSGALVAAEQQINGRMPEQSQTGAAEGAEKRIAKTAIVTEHAPQPPHVAEADVKSLLKVAEAPLPGVRAAVPVPDSATAAYSAIQQTALHRGSEVPAETVGQGNQQIQARPEAVELQRRFAAGQVVRQEEQSLGEADRKVVPADLQPKTERTFESPVTGPEGPAYQASVPVRPEQEGAAAGVKAEVMLVSANAQVVQRVQTEGEPVGIPVQVAGRELLPEGVTAQVADSNDGQGAVQPAEVQLMEPAEKRLEGATLFTGGTVQQQPVLKNEARVVASLQGSDVSQEVPEKGETLTPVMPSARDQSRVMPAEFRFSRSAAVEAAIGGGRQPSVQGPEKNSSGNESSMKMAVVQQTATAPDEGFSGSDAGSNSSDFEGFLHQPVRPVRPAVSNMTGAHAHFFVDTAGATQAPSLQSESFRSGSGEHIAVQVRDQLSTHEIKNGSEQITIRLSPEHLGEIKVNFRLEDRNLKVEIVTENRFAKDSLLQNAEALKESLARQNISMEKFDVTTGGGSTGNQGNNAQGEWRELAKNRQSQQWLDSGGHRTPSAGEVRKTQVYTARADSSVLDLHF